MRKSTIIKKTIRKASKPKQKEISKKIVQRLQKNKRESLRSHATIQLKSKVNEPKPSETKPPTPVLLRDPQSYLKIKELPVYEPTNEEFKQPLLLIKKLRELGYEKYGCIKIRTPRAWNPEFSFNYDGKKLNTRKQSLRDLIKGKDFEQNVNSYTPEEYKEMADEFASSYKYRIPYQFTNQYRANECEFWALVEDAQFMKTKVTVEYAADLPTRKYGSAFPTVYKAKATDDLSPIDEKTHPFNLNNINRAKDSLFQIITTKTENISGITSPWLYFGMLFASFCWHVEDLYMYSVNYMHKGAPKTWYCIPPDYKEDFDRIIKEKYSNLFAKQPNLLYNIVLTMNPLDLIEQNIPVYRTEQCAKEFIITFPKSYHAGFSHGFNVSEAVNIATLDWVPFARAALEDYAKEGYYKKGSFSYEWLIVENLKILEDLDISKPTKALFAKEYELIKEKELQDRQLIYECYPKVLTRQFDDKLNRHDAHICMGCKNFTYLSYLTCMVCNRKTCTHHVTVCSCVNATVILNVRFTDEELENFSKKLKPFLNQRSRK